MTLYTPRSFAVSDGAVASRLIHDYPFATVITPGAPEPAISHLPLLLVDGNEPQGTLAGPLAGPLVGPMVGPLVGPLVGHMARANPHWSHAAAGESIAVFHGPHAYVSPSWYAKPAEAVPTWNYATLHAHGILEPIDDPAETRAILDLLVQRFEGGRASPWQFTMTGPERDKLVGAIVAFRLHVRRIELKLKLSQNRPVEDRARVATALAGEGYAEAGVVAAWMRDYSGLTTPDA